MKGRLLDACEDRLQLRLVVGLHDSNIQTLLENFNISNDGGERFIHSNMQGENPFELDHMDSGKCTQADDYRLNYSLYSYTYGVFSTY